MKIAVKDANVLIDLSVAGILGHWFKLRIETHTTDFVLAEIRHTDQRREVDNYVHTAQLHVHSTPAEDLVGAAELALELGISTPDASVLLLAKELGATLLSGDGALRAGAAAAGVRACGVLWVFDHMIRAGALSPADAAGRLVLLLRSGTFLPRAECEARLKRWSGA